MTCRLCLVSAVTLARSRARRPRSQSCGRRSAGKRIGIADPTTGEIREAEIFVGVLGASNLTYAEAT